MAKYHIPLWSLKRSYPWRHTVKTFNPQKGKWIQAKRVYQVPYCYFVEYWNSRHKTESFVVFFNDRSSFRQGLAELVFNGCSIKSHGKFTNKLYKEFKSHGY